MKKFSFPSISSLISKNLIVLFLIGPIFTIAFYFYIYRFFPNTPIYEFFYQRTFIQFITTWLFFSASAILVNIYIYLKGLEREIKILNKTKLSEEKVLKGSFFISKYLREIYYAYIRGEDFGQFRPVLLNQSREIFENKFSEVDKLKYLILLLGFIGTVFGFSKEMIHFKNITQTVHNIDELRTALQSITTSLSTAFDTTLLALGYSVILTFSTYLLSNKKEKFLFSLNNFIEEYINKLTLANKEKNLYTSLTKIGETFLTQFEEKIRNVLENIFNNFESRLYQGASKAINSQLIQWQTNFKIEAEHILKHLAEQNGNLGEMIVNAIKENNEIISKKLNQFSNGHAGKYIIEVKPVRGEENAN